MDSTQKNHTPIPNMQRSLRCLQSKQTSGTQDRSTDHTFHFLPEDILALLDAHPDYLFCKDTASTYRGCNQRFAELLGLGNPSDIVGLNDYDLPWQKPGHRADFFRADDQAVLAGEPISKQTEALVLPNQPARLMHVCKQPLRNTDGEIYGLFGIARDMTPEINATACLEDLLAQAEQANKSRQLFIANISHSLRTPFTGLIGLNSVLQHDLAGTPHAKLLDVMKGSAEQLLQRLDQLITFANQCKGELTREQAENYAPATLLNDLKMVMQPLAKHKGLQLTLTQDNLPPVLQFTHHTFLSIAINLVSNAISFTDKGTVAIDCQLKDNHLVLTVKDSGIGIAALDTAKLDQPFFSVKPAYTRGTAGLGLGLTLVKQALKDNGGTLSICSQPKQGSCFTVYYSVQIPTTVALPPTPSDDQQAARLLIVEDDTITRYVLEGLFKKLGVAPIFCKSAEEALTTITEQSFDLMITDIGLPGKSGLELAEWVIKNQKNPPPLVALSAHIDEACKAHCLAIGMKAAYQKPLTFHQAQGLLKKYQLLSPDTQRIEPLTREVHA